MIIRNSARCRNCKDEIESKYTHDFVQCKCGAIFVDGGKNYLRCGGEPQYLEDTSIVQEELPFQQTKRPDSTSL